LKKKTLIISYTFPPSNGIGGRRWAKFAKYLSKNERDIYLLTKDIGAAASNKVYSGIKEVDFFKSGYPQILNNNPTKLRDKIYYKLALLYVKLFSIGNYYDRAIFLEKEFLKKAERIVKFNQINEVIITGAPFRLLYFGTLLKKKCKIILLCDIRDPWTWGKGYGMTLLSSERKEKELYFESEVLRHADLITVPVVPMLDHLKSHYPAFSNKIKLLTHAYDSTDFEVKSNDDKGSGFDLVYGGTIYRDLKNEFESIYQLCKENEELDFNLQIHTNRFQYLTKEKLKEIRGKLSILPYVSANELMNKIKNADAYLLIFPDEVKDFITTKFYEIIQCRTPIIYIGVEGDVSKFITSNNLGVHIKPEDIKRQLLEIISSKFVGDHNTKFPIEQYSFKSVTETLLEYLK